MTIRSTVRCTGCGVIYEVEKLDRVKDPMYGEFIWQVCPDRECRTVDNFTHICDEPGCDQSATCGWNSPAGYRHTCYLHATGLHP
jgi:hypothetical protein